MLEHKRSYTVITIFW